MAKRWQAMIAGMLLLTGCGAPALLPTYRPFAPMQQGMRPFGPTSDEVQLLVDQNEIFPAAFELIQSARKTLQVDIYLFGGTIGRKMGDLLLAKKAQGVDVQIVVDPHDGHTPKVQSHIRPVQEYLRSKGLEIRKYPTNRLPAPKPWLKSAAIDHCKIIVADRERAMMGGMNFLDSEAINRDYMLRVNGPLAAQLGDLVDRDWRIAGGAAPAQARGTTQLGETGPDAQTVKPLWLSAIRSAQRTLDIEMLLMDHPDGLAALIDAHKRGVAVRVLLDKTSLGTHSADFVEKLPLQGAPNWSAVQRLTEAGVPVFWYKPRQHWEMLHTKSAIIDGQVAMMGSANFTLRAWGQNREISLRFTDPTAIARLQQEYASDFGMRAERIKRLSRWQSAVAKIWARIMGGKTTPSEAEREIDSLPPDQEQP